MKNKKLYLLFLALMVSQLIVPNSLADIRIIEKYYQVKIEDNILYITGDGLNFERDLSCQNSNCTIDDINRDITAYWYENVSCQAEEDIAGLRTDIKNMSTNFDNFMHDQDTWYLRYNNCYSNLTGCENYKKNNDDYKNAKFDCDNKLQNCQKISSDTKSFMMFYNESYHKEQIGHQDCKSTRFLPWLVAIPSIIYSFWLFSRYKNHFGKRGENPSSNEGRGYNTK